MRIVWVNFVYALDSKWSIDYNVLIVHVHYSHRRRRVDIIISCNTGKPIYEQITSQIKAMIMRGELANGRSHPFHARFGKVPPRERDHGAAGV